MIKPLLTLTKVFESSLTWNKSTIAVTKEVAEAGCIECFGSCDSTIETEIYLLDSELKAIKEDMPNYRKLSSLDKLP